MKKLFTLFVIIALTISVFAQSPQKISYQCVVRNSSGALVANQAIGMKISLLQGSATGTVVFSETYSPNPQTNINGLVTLELGNGTAIVGTLAGIDWASGPYFLKTETDPTGGTNYTISGTTQLLSVPYAMYARTAANGFSGNYNDLTGKPVLFSGAWADITGKPTTIGGYGITDGMNTSHAANGITSSMITNWNTAYGWGNHAGLYKLNSYVPVWAEITGKPTFAAVATSGVFSDLSAKPTTLSGYGITDADGSVTNEIQTLSLAGSILSLSNGGGNVTLPSAGNSNPTGPAGGDLTGTYPNPTIANNAVTVAKLPAGATADTYLRGDGTWAIPSAGSITETDPTWDGDANATGDIGRTGKVGIGTTSPAALLHTQGTETGQGNVVFVGQSKSSNPGNPPISGAGTRMMWYPDRAAFRAGYAYSDEWDAVNIGLYSTAMGFNVKASGGYSTAMGIATIASSYASTAIGWGTTASGMSSTAMGSGTAASGENSTAIGNNTIASGYVSTALGQFNVGGGNASTWVATDPLFEIGNGTSGTSPSNALTVLKNGYVGFGTASPAAGLHIKANNWPGSFIYLEADAGQDAGMRLYEGSSEKWHFFNDASVGGLIIQNNAVNTAIFCQQSTSYVGIGTTTPSCKLQVGNLGDGSQARANAWSLLSDARLKKNFTYLTNPLEMIGKINGYYFYWNTGTDKTRQVGFSAQEVLEVIPEVVSKGEDGYLSIEYGKMTPLLLEAIKQLKAENDELKAENNELRINQQNFSDRLSKIENLMTIK